MKMSVVFAAAAAALFATAAAEARLSGQRPSVPDRCSLAVAFGSYGPGIDLPVLLRMESDLRVNRAVRSFTRHGRGREGEVTLCVRTHARKDIEPVFRRLRALIPARPRGRIDILRY